MNFIKNWIRTLPNEIDDYLETFFGENDVTEDDIDFLEFLIGLTLFEVAIFSAHLESTIERMQFEGLTQTQITSRISEQLTNTTGAFGILLTSSTDMVRYGMREASRLGMMSVYNEVYGDNAQYRWIVARGVKHCADCEQRQGEVHTFNDWVGLGLPASGWRRCNFRCYCMLDPVGAIDDVVQV